jgi:D-alanyl-D-alanine dipeptidase
LRNLATLFSPNKINARGSFSKDIGVRTKLRPSLRTVFVLALAIPVLLAHGGRAQSANDILTGAKPADIPPTWKPWIGEYGDPHPHSPSVTATVLAEKDGFIQILERTKRSDGVHYELGDRFPTHRFSPGDHGLYANHSGKRLLVSGDVVYSKISIDFDARAQVLISPIRPVGELRTEALAAVPPREDGPFRKPDLVELAPLDPSIHLDIRYATSNDFLGTPVYSEARAFLQRPGAEALLRVQQKLKLLSYGLLIHDAYRPWYVTKIFWDATPPEGKIFVADPAQGSRHNRGCAVDLTLYDLATGKSIEMPGTYDEMSPRSFPDYPGGTSLQRWHRDLLRRAMESEGFTVYEAEWWHFDYKDWKEYPILNVPFEKLGLDAGAGAVH